MLLQVAFVGALGHRVLVGGWSHLEFHGDAGPLVGLLSMAGLSWAVVLLYLDVTMMCFTVFCHVLRCVCGGILLCFKVSCCVLRYFAVI